jgi:hypothetical protein
MKYDLTKEEISKLDDYWKFINVFNDNLSNDEMFSVGEYRLSLIKIIKKKYKAEEFYFYEQILNKMLWYLLDWYKINLNKIYSNYPGAFTIKPCSYINKKIMKYNDKYIIFPIYGKLSANIENENLFKILHILRNRVLYEKVMKDKDYINKIKKIDKFYYPSDYPFPNVNLYAFNDNDKKEWIKRIKAYYYSKNDSNWYKLIEC